MPSTTITKEELGDGIGILDLIVNCGLVPSKSEGRRLINQGGLQVDNERVKNLDRIVSYNDFKDNSLLLKKGKKTFHKVILK